MKRGRAEKKMKLHMYKHFDVSKKMNRFRVIKESGNTTEIKMFYVWGKHSVCLTS